MTVAVTILVSVGELNSCLSKKMNKAIMLTVSTETFQYRLGGFFFYALKITVSVTLTMSQIRLFVCD